MKIIGKIGPYTIFTVPNTGIEPGQQWICVNDVGIEAAYVLAVLTGAEVHFHQETAIIEGVYCRMAAHDKGADERLHELVDLCTDIHFKSPVLAQIPIEGAGWDNEQPA